jgi:hypothetical protein
MLTASMEAMKSRTSSSWAFRLDIAAAERWRRFGVGGAWLGREEVHRVLESE